MAEAYGSIESLGHGSAELNSSIESNRQNDGSVRFKSSCRFGSLAMVAVGTIAAGGIFMSFTDMQSIRKFMIPQMDSTSTFQFSARRNGYDYLPYFDPYASNSMMTYDVLENYQGVVEPNGDMYLYVFDSPAEYYYTYSICSDISYSCQTGYFSTDYWTSGVSSSAFNFACDALSETFTVNVYAYDANNGGNLIQTASGSFLCMYVRREIRSLTDVDLTNTMGAMYELWSLSESEGKAKYGDNFHNYLYLLEFHYFNAAWQDADHIHEGNGFLAQHMKMDQIFEQAMQSVNPGVSLPYWDFTIEGAYNLSVWESPIFTADTFGSLALPGDEFMGWSYKNDTVEDARILDGRWADLKSELNTQFPALNYGYGYMRAPWNMNPSTKLTRFTSTNKDLPTCKAHYELLSQTKLSEFLGKVPYAPHGSTHAAVGGVFGCDAMDSLREAGYLNDEQGQVDLCKSWVFYMKEFYRMNILMPRSGCEINDPLSKNIVTMDTQNCGYVCNPSYVSQLMNCLAGTGSKPASTPITNIVNCVNGDLSGSLLNSNDDCVPEGMGIDGLTAWKDFICTGDGYKVFGGDHLESASPADPSFWVIHPTLERLLQAKWMVGGFDTDTWATDTVNDYVCGHHECFDVDSGSRDEWESCCYGHYQDDQYMDFTVGLRSAHTGATNRDVFALAHPTNSSYGLGYIYDHFEWSHCLEDSYDFDALLEELYESSSASASASASATSSATAGSASSRGSAARTAASWGGLGGLRSKKRVRRRLARTPKV